MGGFILGSEQFSVYLGNRVGGENVSEGEGNPLPRGWGGGGAVTEPPQSGSLGTSPGSEIGLQSGRDGKKKAEKIPRNIPLKMVSALWRSF